MSDFASAMSQIPLLQGPFEEGIVDVESDAIRLSIGRAAAPPSSGTHLAAAVVSAFATQGFFPSVW
jgi:hypothetical protein